MLAPEFRTLGEAQTSGRGCGGRSPAGHSSPCLPNRKPEEAQGREGGPGNGAHTPLSTSRRPLCAPGGRDSFTGACDTVRIREASVKTVAWILIKVQQEVEESETACGDSGVWSRGPRGTGTSRCRSRARLLLCRNRNHFPFFSA